MSVSSKFLRLPVVFAATAALMVGVGVTSASASLTPTNCGSSSVVEVVYTPDGNIRYECFSGLGNTDPNLPDTVKVYAGEYDTYAEVYHNGYIPCWINPGTWCDFGTGTLTDLFTESA